MPEPLDCPRCRTTHEPGTQECGCGYNFATQTGGELIGEWVRSERRERLAFLLSLLGGSFAGKAVAGVVAGVLTGALAALVVKLCWPRKP